MTWPVRHKLAARAASTLASLQKATRCARGSLRPSRALVAGARGWAWSAQLVLWIGCWAAVGRAAGRAPEPLHTLLTWPAQTAGERVLHVHRFRLPLAGLHVDVVDLGYTRLVSDALEQADLVVNGGYWGWGSDGRRRVLIGLLRSHGKEVSPLRQALHGGVLEIHRGSARIAPSRGYSGPVDADLAVQCSPRLLADGQVIPKLNNHGRAARTAACVRDSGATLDLYLTEPGELGPPLHDLASWLRDQGCEHALNLDGGPSTAAAFREGGKLVRIGAGRELPYALRFRYARP